MSAPAIPADLLARIRRGTVIPAMPLALTEARQLDLRHQRAVVRYYMDSGAGGLAVGVHTTQFEIRDPKHNLFETVLRLGAETMDDWSQRTGKRFIKIAGICGPTGQALKEAEFARRQGYHAGLLSLAALKQADVPGLIAHCRAVAEIIPIFGFYLQPAVGGRLLPYAFWREFAQIPNVIGIKMAPFNRYQTFDVVRGVAESGRAHEISLYTGNDDNIVLDLLTEYKIKTARGEQRLRIVGGLLGHWAAWTHSAVALLERCHHLTDYGAPIPQEVLTLAQQVTDMNAVIFDVANAFHGCIPGIHEVLRRQGLLPGTWCLNPHEVLSPGQAEELDRVYAAYPHLVDDAFVAANLARWLAD